MAKLISKWICVARDNIEYIIKYEDFLLEFYSIM